MKQRLGRLTATLTLTLTVGLGALAACGSDGDSSAQGSGGGAGAAGEGTEDGGSAGAAGVGGQPGGGTSAGEAGVGPLSEEEMFDQLGVDTKRTPRSYVDEAGDEHELTDSYNPLGSGVKTFQPITELYMAGRGLSAAYPNQVLFEDMRDKTQTALTPLAPIEDADESWLSNKYKVSVAADLDGDGIDEIVNLYWIDASGSLHASVLSCDAGCGGNGGSFKKVKDSALALQDLTRAPTSIDWFRHGFTAADVDGDGKQELVAVNFGGVDVCTANASFGFSCKAAWTETIAEHMSVASGRFDEVPGVERESVVVAWSDGGAGYVSVFDGTPHAFSDNAFSNPSVEPIGLSIKFADRLEPMSFSEAFVTTGDIDLDGRDEIVLAAREGLSAYHQLVLLDDARTGYAPFHAFRYGLGRDGFDDGFGDNHQFRPALRVFTKTTKPSLAKAIYAGSFIFDELQELLPADTNVLPQGKDMGNGVGVTVMSFYESGGGSYNHGPNDVVVGDLDGSGQDTVVAFWDEVADTTHPQTGVNVVTLARAGWDVGSAKWSRWKNIATTDRGLTPYVPGEEGTYDIGLVMANVDHDSSTIKYKGEHEVLFSEPRVLAVLAAPPFFSGVNEGNSQTSIAFGDGRGQGAESTIGVSASASIGYEAPNLFGLTKAAWKLTVGAALDSISSRSVELSETRTWTSGTENAVVFQVIPFDVYYYEVVSSPEPGDVGSTLSINVPRAINTYKVPVELYNASIIDGPHIGPNVLGHTVGDPSTYPTENACEGATGGGTFNSSSFLVDAKTWCYASEKALHVGIGTGSVGFEIARTEASSAGTSQDISVDFETEVGAGGFTVGASVGFHYGYTYTVDTSQSYNFAGQVGDLPDAKRGYDFGLMVHKGTLAGNAESYPVFLVDYWVENVE